MKISQIFSDAYGRLELLFLSLAPVCSQCSHKMQVLLPPLSMPQIPGLRVI